MKGSNRICRLQLDPRSKIFLLFVSNILLFFSGSSKLTASYTVLLSVLLLFSGCLKSVLLFFVIGAGLSGINRFLLPIAPEALIFLFSIFVNYTLKMLPGMMSGALLIMTTSLHEIVLAMRKWTLPQSLIITLSVTIRYFPAIFEEIRHIRDSMKLRAIPLSRKIEGFVISLMMAASTAVEELSAAAVTRGIENPAKKTSISQLRFAAADYAVLLIGTVFIGAALVL